MSVSKQVLEYDEDRALWVDSTETYTLRELVGIDAVYVAIAVGLWSATVTEEGHEGMKSFWVTGIEAAMVRLVSSIELAR